MPTFAPHKSLIIVTFLKNKNISLRALEKEDLAYLYQLENNESARQHNDNPMPLSKHVLKSFILNADKDIFQTRQLRLVIEHNEKCEPIGMIDLFNFSPQHSKAEVGIWIDEDYRDQGFASEALENMCKFAFDTLHINQLFCFIEKNNTKSIKLFKKHNFESKGLLSQWIKSPKGYHDAYILQNTKGE